MAENELVRSSLHNVIYSIGSSIPYNISLDIQVQFS